MKYFFYTILVIGSLGTVAAITNPALVQQGASLIGLELPQNSAESGDETSGEDQLTKFLAQYPSANVPNRDVFPNNNHLPAMNVPMVVVPEPALQPPLPPIYVPPAPSLPEPAAESAAPAYAHSWDNFSPNLGNSGWDSTAAVPVYAPPALDYAPPPDWSGPAQPFQETTAAPQQSVYVVPAQQDFAPLQDVFPVIHDVAEFEQVKYVPPAMPQPMQPSAVQIEEVPVHGTEMVARVGTQVILMGDILPRLRRMALQIIAENIKRMSEEEREKITQQEVEQFINLIAEDRYAAELQEQILFALVYNDYDVSQDRASKAHFDERMGEEFNRVVIPEMLEEFQVENVAALRRFLEMNLGSSLEKERRLWVREQIVREWIRMSIRRGFNESTYEEMLEFYENNKAMFTSVTRVRWQEMVVMVSKHNTEQEAWNKITWMGNRVAEGAPFDEIARWNSDGFTASDGGVRDWTTRGSLTSAELEEAIFSLPIGQVSPAIIKSDIGFHIVRVLERQEAQVVPFVEAQVTIRERIGNQRTQRSQEEYFAELRRRFPTVVVRDRVDFNVNTLRTASGR